MKQISILVLYVISINIAAISIFDIQFTENSGTGTYPSQYDGQTVQTGGIVTGINFSDDKYYISSSNGGAWNGIYVYDNNHSPAIGDSLSFSATVQEYYGFTELINVTNFETVSSNNPLPEPAQIDANTVVTNEAYESVLVSISDVTVSQLPDNYNQWQVEDDSGECQISNGFYFIEDDYPLQLNQQFSSITGIISFGYGSYKLNPRNLDDFVSSDNDFFVNIEDQIVELNEYFAIPIEISSIGDEHTIDQFSMQIEFSNTNILFIEIDFTNAITDENDVEYSISENTINIVSNTTFAQQGTQNLFSVICQSVSSGNTLIELDNIIFNDVASTQSPHATIFIGENSFADTLTVIQRPILSIPEIVVAGNNFHIDCLAPSSTTNWEVKLIYNEINCPLEIVSQNYNSSLQRWNLEVNTANIDFYELYDLYVNADQIEEDTAENAVKVISEYKDNYYFVHITDSHLPTHLFWEDEGSESDTTEINDFRKVINDINLINPEFVIFTGDVVNEGELEEFQNRHYYSKAKRLIANLEVPVYITAGNHDLGGWDSTPPVQGTSRRNWWRFFGWNYLEFPSGEYDLQTQNYTFEYGNSRFIGMEAYDNYDGFMYPIYGETSFTDNQMEWFSDQLNQGYQNDIAFYHYDFDDQLNLNQMGIDMALWGHVHTNEGSIYTTPYNLATASVCDGNSAFRVIKMDNEVLDPQNTTYSGNNGNNLNVSYTPANNGLSNNVTANIQNNLPISFEYSLIKFVMPAGIHQYEIINGELIQVDNSGEFNVCYVNTNIVNNSNTQTSISIINPILDENDTPHPITEFNVYPNPFNPICNISFSLSDESKVLVSVYNSKGQLVKNIVDENMKAGKHNFIWNSKNSMNKIVSSGQYFINIKTTNNILVKKINLIK